MTVWLVVRVLPGPTNEGNRRYIITTRRMTSGELLK